MRVQIRPFSRSGETQSYAVEDEAAWASAWAAGCVIRRSIVDALWERPARRGPPDKLHKQSKTSIACRAHATAARPALILAPVVSPSGLPSDGQSAEGPVLRAHRTVTFTRRLKVSQRLSQDADAVGCFGGFRDWLSLRAG